MEVVLELALLAKTCIRGWIRRTRCERDMLDWSCKEVLSNITTCFGVENSGLMNGGKRIARIN